MLILRTGSRSGGMSTSASLTGNTRADMSKRTQPAFGGWADGYTNLRSILLGFALLKN